MKGADLTRDQLQEKIDYLEKELEAYKKSNYNFKCETVFNIPENIFFDLAGVLMVLIGEDQKVKMVNQRGAEILGYPQEEIIGKNWFDNFIPPEDKEEIKNIFNSIISGDLEPYKNVETNIIRSNGEERIISWHTTYLEDENGNIYATLSSGDDLTNHKKTEESLKKALKISKKRTAEAQSFIKANKAILEYQNFDDAARAIFDECVELIGATSGYVALLSDDGKENEVLFLEAGGLPCTVDPELPMPIRGLRGEAYVRGEVVYDNNFMESPWVKYMPPGHVDLNRVLFAPLIIEGKTVGLLGIANKKTDFNDEDARVAAVFGEFASIALANSRNLEKLEEREEKYRVLMQDASDSIFLSDLKGNWIDVNKRAENLTGYKREELLNLINKDLFPEDDFNLLKKSFKTVIDKGYAQIKDIHILKKDGGIVPVEITGSIISYGDKKVVQGIFRDVSVQKEAQRQTEQALQEKEVLLKEIYHRVKNNLMVISSLLNLQSKYIKDQKALSMFKESQSRAKSMALIHERLYRSTDLKNMDFGEYIQTLANDLFHNYSPDPGRIDLVLDVQHEKLDINTAIPLGLIVNELLSNALKHAFPSPNKGTIKVQFYSTEREYGLVVSDDGVGFPSDIDFTQTKSLGLQLVNTLTEQLDGKVELDRAGGTSFKITFQEKPI